MYSLFKLEKFDNWNNLIKYYLDIRKKWNEWIFRGQSNSKWDLETKIERVAYRKYKIPRKKIPHIEAGLLRKFKRQYHIYSNYIPNDNSKIEWLSIMQHHGAPTRLLDFTYSFFVALFFAVENVAPNQYCAIWAVDPQWISDLSKSRLPSYLLEKSLESKEPEIINKIYWHNPPIPLIFAESSIILNQRLTAQQGVFLVPGDITLSFNDNLKAVVNKNECYEHLIKIEIYCTKDFLTDAYEELYRMKLDAVTLFPGIDGFARQLESLILVPNAIWVDENEIAS